MLKDLHHVMQGFIFDLDGVLVDTARFHYQAWKRLAAEMGFDFSERDNELLKGVSRMRSLEILLEIGKLTISDEEKTFLAEKKNHWYVELLNQIDASHLLPGTWEYLNMLKTAQKKVALGSASKNASFILQKLKIYHYFDVIIDGNLVSKAKPDPEVFVKAADGLDVPYQKCVVFEDSQAGIMAAKSAGMNVVAVGNRELLPGADWYVQDLSQIIE
ncbi:beta-phosphoglucomutase [Gracilinema caldarium]|uniref:beta-phosphoglucomutase n=1 Tax=Gracilinema caldarium TaxID=215591 RepID=UPI0026EABCC6|nr:beta-phosphoglucomutase [Gracilinema caldarium]